jgi:hypothetical protein
MIGSTLDTREALDRARAAGAGLHLRNDDAPGHAALAACVATGEPRAECLAEVESAIDSRGFYCGSGVLHITLTGRTCGVAVEPTARKLAILEAEAAAHAGPSPLLLAAGGAAVLLIGWLLLK